MEHLPELTEKQWTELLERLTWHAQRKFLRLVWQGIPAASGGRAPGGIEPPDLAAQAILDVLEGRRSWNRAAEPDFLRFLQGVVDSKVGHLARGRENRPSRAPVLAEEIPSREPTPELSAVAGDNLAHLQHILISAVGQDPVAWQVIECLESGLTRPAEIALRLGIPVRAVYNARKRLRQKIGMALKATRGDEL
ncbi:MAG: RNA polymerase sigma factor [Gemmata sp.]